MKLLAVLALLLILVGGCGYAPASHYAKNVVGESVSTEVVILMEDPQNTVLIKDAVDNAVITKFRTALVGKNVSKTHLKINVESVVFTPLRYDTDGYVIAYRTVVLTRFNRVSGEDKGVYETRGIYDFAIDRNAIISEQDRFEAINQGAQKCIDAFIAQLAVQGANSKKR